ncbi:uncharacterized protein LOC125869885 [Solanum stenotomum]|uniref:uncharacterized protein LOC125869885 n=1 Tax=Solanum stenotomum TaxID=172797 RepID=UPI0020D10164|nr:uncharacterized protein LOC125869885 [Solanum stenotomum]
MIERDITDVLTLLKASIDGLSARVDVCEREHGVSTEVIALKVNVSELRKEVNQLKSTDFTPLFGTVEIHNDLSAEIPACVEVPLATTKDDIMQDVVAAEYEAETNEEHLAERDAAIYEGMANLEGAMFET